MDFRRLNVAFLGYTVQEIVCSPYAMLMDHMCSALIGPRCCSRQAWRGERCSSAICSTRTGALVWTTKVLSPSCNSRFLIKAGARQPPTPHDGTPS